MKKSLISLFAAALLALSQAGCIAAALGAAAAAGGAGYLYYNGELRAHSSATPPELVGAAVDALQELGLAIDESGVSEIDGFVDAHTAADTKIEFRTRLAEEHSRFSLRVGTFGDDALTDEIFDGIRARIGSERIWFDERDARDESEEVAK